MVRTLEITHKDLHKVDYAYAMALADTYEPVSVADITPAKAVKASAVAFADAFEFKNMVNAVRNTYSLSM